MPICISSLRNFSPSWLDNLRVENSFFFVWFLGGVSAMLFSVLAMPKPTHNWGGEDAYL